MFSSEVHNQYFTLSFSIFFYISLLHLKFCYLEFYISITLFWNEKIGTLYFFFFFLMHNNLFSSTFLTCLTYRTWGSKWKSNGYMGREGNAKSKVSGNKRRREKHNSFLFCYWVYVHLYIKDWPNSGPCNVSLGIFPFNINALFNPEALYVFAL